MTNIICSRDKIYFGIPSGQLPGKTEFKPNSKLKV